MGTTEVRGRAKAGRGVGGASRRSLVLALATTVLGLIHHVDHVLRVDHSGWPFRDEVTSFTYSLLLVYPIILFVFLVRSRPSLGAGALALLLVALQGAHVFAETPGDQYGVWANNTSTDPHMLGQPNLLGIESPALGVLAAGESILLSIFLLATVVSLVVDARRARVRKAK